MKIGIGVIFLLIGGLLAIGSLGTAIALYNKDDDGDGTPAIVDSDDTGGTSTVDDGVTIISGGVDLNADGDYDDAGDIAPPPEADINLVITDLYMDSLYNVEHRLHNQIFLLEPLQGFKEYVTLDNRGSKLDNTVCVELYLQEGSLPNGALLHKTTDTTLFMSKECSDGLDKGEALYSIEGKVPDWNPGHDWHLGLVVITVDGKEVVRKTNNRLDELNKPRWMTKMYENGWCDINAEVLKGCVDSTIGSAGVTLEFNTADAHFLEDLSRVRVEQLTYAGKWVTVYDGPLETMDITAWQAMTAGGIAGSLIPGAGTIGGALAGLLIDATGVLENEFNAVIPFEDFVSVEANEGYMKIALWDEEGNPVDLNVASDDVHARINLDQQIVGTNTWKSDTEYFNMLGILRGYSTVGGNHPESMYFE